MHLLDNVRVIEPIFFPSKDELIPARRSKILITRIFSPSKYDNFFLKTKKKINTSAKEKSPEPEKKRKQESTSEQLKIIIGKKCLIDDRLSYVYEN